MALQDLRIVHVLHSVSKNAAVSGQPPPTRLQNLRALIASFILTQMRARGDAAFLIGGLYLALFPSKRTGCSHGEGRICASKESSTPGLYSENREPGESRAIQAIIQREQSEPMV
jgi:hypothetical protein